MNLKKSAQTADKKENEMSKIKYKLAIGLAALLVIGGAMYIYFAHYAPYRPDAQQEVSVWYVNDDAMWSGFEALCAEYNEGDGAEYGITVVPRGFESSKELYDEVCAAAQNGSQLPDMLACDTDFAAYLDSESLLADMDAYFGKWETSDYDEAMLGAATGKNGLVAVPIAAETNVFILNTEMFSDAGAISSFEKLCSVAGEYYKRNTSSFFSISDYSMFFRSSVAQLGDEFDGVSPYDTDNENCKYVYKLLAETAYDRGVTSTNGKATQLLADGEIAAAIVSSADIMQYAAKLDDDRFVFADFPYMKDGKPVYTERVLGMTILASDESRERSSQMFLRWLCSAKVNSRFVADSGYMAAIGTQSGTSEHPVYGRLMEAIDKMQSDARHEEYAANAEYSVNSRNFDNVLNTIMDSLN